MNPESLLLTHAELALGLGGFGSVVAALRRPLSPFRRQRFIELISLALIQIIACIFPVWLAGVTPNAALTWRLASAAAIVLGFVHTVVLIVLPARRIPELRVLINPALTAIGWTLGVISFLALTLNVIAWSIVPSFSLYYVGLATALGIGFLSFIDVAAGTDSTE